jgi:hypothetical protein
MAQAMGINPSQLIAANFLGSDPLGAGIANADLGHSFPSEGDSFAILSTGKAADADLPNNTSGLSTELGGLNNSQGNDMVQLRLDLAVPSGMNCATFDFGYYSEEFPDYVGGIFNDTFTAEFGGTQIIINGNDVSAPLNFAYDTQNNIISVNTVFGVAPDTATTYNGGTSLLRAQTPVTAGSNAVIVFTVQDLGDSIYDSAVFLDNFFWSNDDGCGGASQADSDGDGLLDVWETNGLGGVDLAAMGADPMRKDIFVEVDYMDLTCTGNPAPGCIENEHSHQPHAAALALVVDAFADAPVTNPDGSTGITMHIDNGPASPMKPDGTPWGALSAGNAVPHDDHLGTGAISNYSWTEFNTIRDTHFPAARLPLFHYVLFAHQLSTEMGMTSGLSYAPYNELIVSLGGWEGGYNDTFEQAGTFMHELGHNLGLDHGGINDGINEKPNYFSVMNYLFQVSGMYTNGSNGLFDYSRFDSGVIPDLNENSLAESQGLGSNAAISAYQTLYYCPNKNLAPAPVSATSPIDWNCDGAISTGTIPATNINEITNTPVYELLQSHNDWDALIYNGGAIGRPGATPPAPTGQLPREITLEEANAQPKPYHVIIKGGGTIQAAVGTESVSHSFRIVNQGTKPDTYTIAAQSSHGWTIAAYPVWINLAPGQYADVPLKVFIPAAANVDTVDVLTIRAHSQIDANTHTEHAGYTRIVPTVKFQQTGYSVHEKDLSALATVQLSQSSAQTVTVYYKTSNGNAIAGTDYTTANGMLTFLPGETTQIVSVPLLEDGLKEGAETFTLSLLNANGAIIRAPEQATISIQANDAISFSSLEFIGREGEYVVATVNLNAPSRQTVTVQYRTRDGSALGSIDYTKASGTLTFQPGETSKQIKVFIISDKPVDDYESFRIELSLPANAELTAPSSTTITIVEGGCDPTVC